MEFATTRKQKVTWMCYKFQNEMKNTNTMKWYEISPNKWSWKSTWGSLTSKTAFCNEVRVQFKLNVKTKLQLRESLSAVFRINWRKYLEWWRKFDAEDKLENPMNIGQNQTRNLSLWFPLCKRWGNYFELLKSLHIHNLTPIFQW